MAINVKLQDLPASVKGFTKKHNGEYTIILNAKHDDQTRQETYWHELAHITRDDHSREDTIRLEIELVKEF